MLEHFLTPCKDKCVAPPLCPKYICDSLHHPNSTCKYRFAHGGKYQSVQMFLDGLDEVIKSDYDQNPTLNTVFGAVGVKRDSVKAAMHELLIYIFNK